ncbi:MAG TPA: helix-turn-helix domain-containing protein [Mycobacterium sp.]
MPLRSDWSGETCPIARSLDVVGDPWMLLILRQALLGVRRYDDLRSALGVADNVLSRRLPAMVEAGLLQKVPYRGEQRTHHEYVLTEAGADLLPVLNALLIWGEKHTSAPQPGAHMGIVHRTCGAESTSADRCSNCAEPLTAAEVSWSRSWRSPDPQPLTPAR